MPALRSANRLVRLELIPAQDAEDFAQNIRLKLVAAQGGQDMTPPRAAYLAKGAAKWAEADAATAAAARRKYGADGVSVDEPAFLRQIQDIDVPRLDLRIDVALAVAKLPEKHQRFCAEHP